MTNEHEQHIKQIQNDFSDLSFAKYEKGVNEHGGHLMDMSAEQLLNEAINEAIDQVIYLLSLKQKLYGC